MARKKYFLCVQIKRILLKRYQLWSWFNLNLVCHLSSFCRSVTNDLMLSMLNKWNIWLSLDKNMCRFKHSLPFFLSLCIFCWIEELNNRHVLIRCAILLGLINENNFFAYCFVCTLSIVVFSPLFFFVWFLIDACQCTRVQTTLTHTHALSCRFIREYHILLGSTQTIIYMNRLKHRVHFKFQLRRHNVSTLTTYFTIILSQHYI